jgi:phosphoglycolate phosphatase
LSVPAAVIFDLDGVLIDSYEAVTGAVNAALIESGLAARPQTTLRAVIGPPTFTAFSQLIGQPPESAAVAEIVARYRAQYARVYLRETTVIEGVVPMLEALSERLPLAIATSKSVRFTEPLLDALNLSRFFATVEAAALDDTSDNKTAIVGRVLSALERAPAAMVGDRSFDIEAAHAHGLVAIGVTWGIGSPAELRDAGADVLIDTPQELLALLTDGDSSLPPIS